MQGIVGIDIGGTLTKVAYFDYNYELQLHYFYSNELCKVRDWIKENTFINEVCITGGKAEQFKQVIASDSLHTSYIVEFDATCLGVQYLLNKADYSLDNYIITNIGTGTSIHSVTNSGYFRAGGTGIGGGTLMGLCKLLTGLSDFKKIIEVSKHGSRSQLDIKVSDIYKGIVSPVDGDLTASNFGKAFLGDVVHSEISDVTATVQGLVGEVVTTLSIYIAETQNIDNIIYIGSTLSDNEPLKTIIGNYTAKNNKNPIFLKDHGFSGAVGALMRKRNLAE